MSSTTALTFTATVMAGDAEQAVAKAEKYAAKVPGLALTGRVEVRSQRHLLWTVELAANGADVNDAWVVLTSYGITPGDELGSAWQQVPGVGRFE